MAAYKTKQRSLLLNYLASHPDESLTAADIAAGLASERVSLSAVYRNLSALEEEERVRRVTRGGGREVYYQYTDTEECRAHLHLLCKSCGATAHMDKADADYLMGQIARREHFAVDTVDTVVYGTCQACQIKESMRRQHEKA